MSNSSDSAAKTGPAGAAAGANSSDTLSTTTTTSAPASSAGGSLSGSLILEDIREGELLQVSSPVPSSTSAAGNDKAGPNGSATGEGKQSESEQGEGQGQGQGQGQGDTSVNGHPVGSVSGGPDAATTLNQSNDSVTATKLDSSPANAETARATIGSDSPLATILAKLSTLPPKEQEVVRRNIEAIASYPRELPLSGPWTLHFSDTSGANKSNQTTADAYDDAVKPVFTADSVPSLCGALKAFKKAARPKRGGKLVDDSLGLTRAGQNLHFFRAGVSPTWEDGWNAKGGRLTISPPAAIFESTYERLVLLLAGSVIECSARDALQAAAAGDSTREIKEGRIVGVVASRRARGDRIELWLGGPEQRTPAPSEWIDKVKESVSVELGMAELRQGRYKKHFS